MGADDDPGQEQISLVRTTSVDETLADLEAIVRQGVSAEPGRPTRPRDALPGFRPVRGWVRGTSVRIDAVPYGSRSSVLDVFASGPTGDSPPMRIDGTVVRDRDGSRFIALVGAPGPRFEVGGGIALITLVGAILLVADQSPGSVVAVTLIAVGVGLAWWVVGRRRQRVVHSGASAVAAFLEAALDRQQAIREAAERQAALHPDWETAPDDAARGDVG